MSLPTHAQRQAYEGKTVGRTIDKRIREAKEFIFVLQAFPETMMLHLSEGLRRSSKIFLGEDFQVFDFVLFYIGCLRFLRLEGS